MEEIIIPLFSLVVAILVMVNRFQTYRQNEKNKKIRIKTGAELVISVLKDKSISDQERMRMLKIASVLMI